MLLGCIADDFTGATDLANNLVRGGLRTIQTSGVPAPPLDENVDGDVDAIVVALKSRTIPAADAVAQSLAALDWLRARDCRQIYFKYCSTFDSTPAGNIGPVTQALMAHLGCRFTIACPAFPENARTVYKGHLFVGDVPLSESGMQHHPLTPMTDANLVRVLQAQTALEVGRVDLEDVMRGPDAIRRRFSALEHEGVGIAIVDAVSNDDLMRLGLAAADMPLVTAGSGVAIGLPQNFAARGLLRHASTAGALPSLPGHRAIVSGSCSTATRGQVADFVASGGAARAIDALALARGPVLVYSTADPGSVKAVQAQIGTGDAGAMIERSLAAVACGLVDAGVTQLVVAGGETSGAIVQALGAKMLRIGTQIDPGVPWTATIGPRPVLLALKSGNFGSRDFFAKAFRLLERS
jgi:uncharacterized protein YgbK (DUF1537 family)